MNPFEQFQQLKPQILQDRVFMENLRLYAFTERKRLSGDTRLQGLGSGKSNTHYLTRGGTANFKPAERNGRVAGTIDGVTVYHDFDSGRFADLGDYLPRKYLAEEHLLILRK